LPPEVDTEVVVSEIDILMHGCC